MTIVIIELDDDRNYICQALRFGIFDMRVSKEKAADNRDRILTAASRLIRERGIAGVGVDTLTEAAGMTHGSLYSQFGFKQRLVEEAIAAAIASKGRDLSETTTAGDYISEYLSPAHRDDPGSGCPFAALCCEMQRQTQGARERFTAGVNGMVEWLSARIGSGTRQRQRDEDALVTLASLVGAVVLARAVSDPKLSADILRATRKKLLG